MGQAQTGEQSAKKSRLDIALIRLKTKQKLKKEVDAVKESLVSTMKHAVATLRQPTESEDRTHIKIVTERLAVTQHFFGSRPDVHANPFPAKPDELEMIDFNYDLLGFGPTQFNRLFSEHPLDWLTKADAQRTRNTCKGGKPFLGEPPGADSWGTRAHAVSCSVRRGRVLLRPFQRQTFCGERPCLSWLFQGSWFPAKS